MAVLERHFKVVEEYLQTAPPAFFLPWRQASFAVLGLEAIGPEPHQDEIASIACVPVEQGKAIMRKASEATLSRGGEALAPIVEALKGRVLVAHGASRHVGFLSAVFERAGLALQGQVLDTAMLAARVAPRAPAEGDRSWSPADVSPGLSEAASAIGLPVHPHEAGGEALTTAQLFMALASKLDRLHPQSVGSLARHCSKKGDCNRRVSR
jgi:DNA polymerase III subunit epsilon